MCQSKHCPAFLFFNRDELMMMWLELDRVAVESMQRHPHISDCFQLPGRSCMLGYLQPAGLHAETQRQQRPASAFTLTSTFSMLNERLCTNEKCFTFQNMFHCLHVTSASSIRLCLDLSFDLSNLHKTSYLCKMCKFTFQSFIAQFYRHISETEKQ